MPGFAFAAVIGWRIVNRSEAPTIYPIPFTSHNYNSFSQGLLLYGKTNKNVMSASLKAAGKVVDVVVSRPAFNPEITG
jgi:hypothetical protein